MSFTKQFEKHQPISGMWTIDLEEPDSRPDSVTQMCGLKQVTLPL